MIIKGLTAIELNHFKSFQKSESIQLAPVTVLLGKNSSGKTSVIQSLLLLKQTLEYAPIHVPLKIDGPLVKFSHLDEITYQPTGKLSKPAPKSGPGICLAWDTQITLDEAKETITRKTEVTHLVRREPLEWLRDYPPENSLLIKSWIRIQFSWDRNRAVIEELLLESLPVPVDREIVHKEPVTLKLSRKLGSPAVDPVYTVDLKMPGAKKLKEFSTDEEEKLALGFQHFVPVITQARDGELRQAYRILFRLPLQGLVSEIRNITFLGPLRAEPMRSYPHAGIGIGGNIDPAGAMTAEILAQERNTLVHYAPYVRVEPTKIRTKLEKDVSAEEIHLPDRIESQPLILAVDQFLKDLLDDESEGKKGSSIDSDGAWGTVYRLSIGDEKRFTIADVGFGVSQILPILLAGLRSDWVYGEEQSFNNLADYNSRATSSKLIILEQPEIHLHPAAQSRLAQFIVSMALCGRRFLIETHSDHFVTRLRGLVARAAQFEDEQKLLEAIAIVNFNYRRDGTEIVQIRLDDEGKFIRKGTEDTIYWPAGFMDYNPREEEQILYGWVNKQVIRMGR